MIGERRAASDDDDDGLQFSSMQREQRESGVKLYVLENESNIGPASRGDYMCNVQQLIVIVIITQRDTKRALIAMCVCVCGAYKITKSLLCINLWHTSTQLKQQQSHRDCCPSRRRRKNAGVQFK